MESRSRGRRPQRLQIHIVRGEPYRIGSRSLIPVAWRVYLGRARGTIRRDSVSGWGGGMVWLRPLAILEETPDGVRRYRIHDATALRLWCLAALAAFGTLLSGRIRAAARCRRQEEDGPSSG